VAVSYKNPITGIVEAVRAALHMLPSNVSKKALARLDIEAEVLLRAPAAAQPRIAAAIVHQGGPLAPALEQYRALGDTPICASYPNALLDHQAAIVLGKRPMDLFPGFTAAEAHAYLSRPASPARTPARWLLDEAGFGQRGPWEETDKERIASALFTARPESIAVARWLIACARDPERSAALLRNRTANVAGVEVEGILITRIDEICAADLDAQHPERTSVRDAFERAGQRAYRAWEREVERDPKGTEPLAPKPLWIKRLPTYARLLLSSRALLEEGRAMRHCVGTYASAVRQRRCHIVSICLRARGEVLRSTAEISVTGLTVLQHRGVGNATPHPLCQRALQRAIDRARVAHFADERY
jgi:hypothetical protein